MNKEIERKYLVKNASFIGQHDEHWKIRQGFIMIESGRCLRIREDDVGDRGVKYTLCLKISHSAVVRDEYEYIIPAEDGKLLLESCENVIEKERYRVMTNPISRDDSGRALFWDIDIFHGKNEGLIVAEMELPDENYPFEKPDWVGEEVTDDPRYLNTNLSKVPFTEWP